MELKAIVASIEAVGFRVHEDGLVASEDGRTWFALIDGGALRLANPMNRTGLTRINLDDVVSIGSVSEWGLMSIETTITGMETFPGASVQMNPPPAREHPEVIEIPRAEIDLSNLKNNLMTYHELLPIILPEMEGKVYYDILQECIMADMSVFGRPDLGVVRFTDTCAKIYYLAVERAIADMGLKVRFSRVTMDEGLTVWASEHRINRFLEWLDGLTWDGKRRVDTVFQDLLGAMAPALSQEDERRYLGAVARAWLVGAVARAYEPTKHEIVPVLISRQGMGKGSALCFLAGRDEWYYDSAISVAEPAKFLDAARGHIIVEMSESTQLRNDVEKLKAFVSQKADQMRKPYARFEESYPRHFILAASSNNDSIFTDITGNRRFFPIYCDPDKATVEISINRAVNQDYVEQVWAEVHQMYRDGARCWMTEQEADLATDMQDYATVENGNILAIDQFLDNPLNGLDKVGSKVSREYIMREIFGCTGTTPIPKDLETAYRAWSIGTRYWEKARSTIRVNGKVSRGFVRIYAPGDRPKVKRLKIVDGKEEPGELLDELRRVAEGKAPNDQLDLSSLLVRGMSRRDAIDKLMEEGWIWNERVNGREVYRLAEMP